MKKNARTKQWIKEYEAECVRQENLYEQWIEAWETAPFHAAQEDGLDAAGDSRAEYVIFTGKDGKLSEDAKARIGEYFDAHPDTDVVYGDEDEWNLRLQKRQNPWFKPDWSPDTLRSCMYVGNIVAVRNSALDLLPGDFKKTDHIVKMEEVFAGGCMGFWDGLIELEEKTGRKFGHIDSVLYHKSVSGEDADAPEEEQIRHRRYPASGQEKTVSVVIPSKDHPELLRQCLTAIKEITEYPAYELIVADNGSSAENRDKIRALQEEISFTWIYEEMEFNFSRMCNLGAKRARGDLLLFLNDDIEVNGGEWMRILAEAALQPHIGAVGAKLYYPGSKIIQHAGITNMKMGPAHKLCGMEDRGNIYHGRNLADYNVIAVTAACLMIEKKKFDAVGGFCEELPVAYNDVDLCFSLYERGYYNLIRNDVTLYHHESLSRGSDEEGEKSKRLVEERKRLYRRHPGLYGRDPFYSRHLVQERMDADYHTEYQYDHENGAKRSWYEKIAKPAETGKSLVRKILKKGPWMMYHMDEVRKRWTDLLREDSAVLEFEGWCGLTDLPMTEYDRSLLLVPVPNDNEQSDGGVSPDGILSADSRSWQLELFDKLRPDARAVLTDQPYGALCGFVARVKTDAIPSGDYRVGYCFSPRRGGKKLIQYGETIHI